MVVCSPLYSINKVSVHFFHDTNMIGYPVALPVEKDNITGDGFIVTILPLAAVPETNQ